MRRPKRSGNLFLTILINILFNIEGVIPALILLALHFIFDWPIWLFWVAFGLWVLWLVIWIALISWSAKCSSEIHVFRENKNPYSKNNEQVFQSEIVGEEIIEDSDESQE